MFKRRRIGIIPQKYSNETIEQFKFLYSEKKLSCAQAAQELNMAKSTASFYARKLGISRGHSSAAYRLRDRTKYTDEMLNKIKHLYLDEQLSAAGVADVLGDSRYYMSYIIAKLGITRSRSHARRMYLTKREALNCKEKTAQVRYSRQRAYLINQYHISIQFALKKHQEGLASFTGHANRQKVQETFAADIKPSLEGLFRNLARLKEEYNAGLKGKSSIRSRDNEILTRR